MSIGSPHAKSTVDGGSDLAEAIVVLPLVVGCGNASGSRPAQLSAPKESPAPPQAATPSGPSAPAVPPAEGDRDSCKMHPTWLRYGSGCVPPKTYVFLTCLDRAIWDFKSLAETIKKFKVSVELSLKGLGGAGDTEDDVKYPAAEKGIEAAVGACRGLADSEGLELSKPVTVTPITPTPGVSYAVDLFRDERVERIKKAAHDRFVRDGLIAK